YRQADGVAEERRGQVGPGVVVHAIVLEPRAGGDDVDERGRHVLQIEAQARLVLVDAQTAGRVRHAQDSESAPETRAGQRPARPPRQVAARRAGGRPDIDGSARDLHPGLHAGVYLAPPTRKVAPRVMSIRKNESRPTTRPSPCQRSIFTSSRNPPRGLTQYL